MLTTKPTVAMIAEWKRIFEAYRFTLKPNRKTGSEVDRYFKTQYPYQAFDDEEFRQMVALGIMENEFSRKKLPRGALPNVQSYQTDHVLVGIDVVTGEFHVESEDIEKVKVIHDDLFVYRGLDEDDLTNYFLVAEYVRLTQS